jgi:hypothetical protein
MLNKSAVIKPHTKEMLGVISNANAIQGSVTGIRKSGSNGAGKSVSLEIKTLSISVSVIMLYAKTKYLSCLYTRK